MERGKREKQTPAKRPGAQHARLSKPTSVGEISPSRASSLGTQPEGISLTRMLETLRPHDHLCLIYESQEEWRAAAVPFIAIGLKRGEKCIYIVDTSTADEIRKYLGEGGVDVASAEKSGQLSVLHETEVYTKEGSFDPDRMIALLISEAGKAVSEGYPALRVTGEMTWVLHGHPGSEKLLEYEAKLNRDLFPKYPCVSICQYDRWKFDPEIIKGVIMTHPLLVRGNHIYHNFYYVPPEEFLNRKRAELEVQHWLNNVEREQRIMDTLRQSEERYRFLVELSPEAISVHSEGKVVFTNSAGLKLMGASSPDQIIGKPVADFVHPDYREIAAERIRKAMETGIAPAVMEEKVLRLDGAVVDVEVRAALLVYQGKPAMQIIASDITERKRQEEERRQLEQKAQLASRLASVGEMAAGIAHEINNPLTSVIGYSQLLSDREDVSEDVKADLKAIDEGAQRVAGIIKRLLAFARQSKPERAFVSINHLITNTLDLRAYHLRTNNIKVTAKLATDLPLTTADPAQLQQVFLNIIVNAEAAMTQAHGGGKLLVKTEEMNGTIRISFKDNGSGIAKENLLRIFDPFFTTREVDQGTGLGLSICHGIVAEHKGRIWAESTLGRGATFIVELPIVTGSIQLEMAEPSEKKLGKVPKAKILVVDDELSTLELLSCLFTDEGHDVETVNNADEALEMVKNRRYSLILLDIKMPGTSGIELYGRMQKIALSLAERVIFITGDVMGPDTEAFLSRTKAPYITKPLDVRQLKKKIKSFLTGD